MKKWTEAQPRAANLADYEEFNLAYDPLKSTFNGGIGRPEIPAAAIGQLHIASEALIQVTVAHDGQFPDTGDPFEDTNTGASPGFFRGTSYDVYTGGWINILTRNYTNLKSGFVHVELQTHLFVQSYYAGDQTDGGSTVDGNPKAVRVRLLWNGTPVAESAFYTQPVQSVRVFADFPSPGGPGELTVQAICNAASELENFPSVGGNYAWPLFQFFGMNTLMIGRWR